MDERLKASNQQVQKTFIKDSELWDQAPEMGAEGLIATIDDPKELLKALDENSRRNTEKIMVKDRPFIKNSS